MSKNITKLVGQTLFIVTTEADLKGFTNREDRVYFAKPVAVHVDAVRGELLTVTDPARGHTYPCDPKNLRTRHGLTSEQLKQVS